MILLKSIILLIHGIVVVQLMQLEQGTTSATVLKSGIVNTLFLTQPGRNLTIHIENEHQVVILPCDVDGNPKPTIFKWSKVGLPPKVRHSYRSKNSLLEIPFPHPIDEGEFVCNACNDLDCLNSTVTLNLVFKFDNASMKNQSVVEGNIASFNCELVINSNTIIRYDIVKEDEGNELKIKTFNSKTIIGEPTIEDFVKMSAKTKIIKNVTKADEGWYTCLVSYYNLDYSMRILAKKNAYLKVLSTNEGNRFIGGLIVLITVVCIILALVVFVMYRRIKLNKKYYERLIKIVTIRNQSNGNDIQMPVVSIELKKSLTAVNTNYHSSSAMDYEFPIDLKWEFPRDKLTFGDLLGAGAFGKVVKANAEGLLGEGVSTTVAVKMLKDDHTDEEIKDFVCEMEIMKNIGGHPNIINLLGCCTQNGPLLIIVEYAARGNLKNFLQIDSPKDFNTYQLVSFASQIVSGMQHLSSKKLIHRDLAARNVLVTADRIMKIADFGLARDVYNQEYYRKITSGKMPIRWMAPESLEERFFNTKSDVWSFGVLLWEIMTRGRDPYPFVADWQSFLEYLKRGKRLEQPGGCPDRIYCIMELCWEFDPVNRPSFDQIRGLLENCTILEYLDFKEPESLNYAVIVAEN